MNNKILVPVFVAFALIIGLYTGLYFGMRGSSDAISFVLPNSKNSTGKLGQILTFIEQQYVDTVEQDKLINKAIESLLSDLDPHSYYISSEDALAYTDPLEGKFEGIGVEFLLQKDTVVVINTVEGGPSSKAGIKAGDRIVTVDSLPFAGTNLDNKTVMNRLRGAAKSTVNLGIYRPSDRDTIVKVFAVTRGNIPINSVDAAYMYNDTTAYIKISRFAKTTYTEFNTQLRALSKKNRKLNTLIIDLKNNGGGYLNAAIEICDELLPKGDLIVFTKGKSRAEKKYYSEKEGAFAHLNTKVIINESSASASEILAGAIQDNDRGTIVGRRSFGKGLVQEHIELRDHSALRLTVARYYTPSGRCIQKPYGDTINYSSDMDQRIRSGELYYKDSILIIDSLIYTTKKGKKVYGGGGIVPDVFVSLDTTKYSNLLDALLYSGTINQFAFNFIDTQRGALKVKYPDFKTFNKTFVISTHELKALFEFAGIESLKPYNALNPTMKRALDNRLKAFIARDLFGIGAYYQILNTTDKDIQATVKA